MIINLIYYIVFQTSYEDLGKEMLAFNRNICLKASKVFGDGNKTKSWLTSLASFVRTCYSKFWHYRDVLSPLVVRKLVIRIIIAKKTITGVCNSCSCCLDC